jgi:hypothetical protein
MPSSTQCVIEVDGKAVDEVTEFDYVYSVLGVGDESRVKVINLDRKYTAALQIGQTIRIKLAHPDVNGGELTLKHLGLIVDRDHELSAEAGGVLSLVTADLGWHLQNCCAPLWFNLKKATYKDLCDPSRYQVGKRGQRLYFIDPSFGIKGVRFEGNINRRLKQGLAAVAAAANQVIDPVYSIQVEPGEMIFDKIVEYARRLNRLVNVSVDGFLQVWNPDYRQEPLYKFTTDGKDANVLRCRVHESARSVYTTVEVVGEQIGYEGTTQDSNDPNARKKRGAVYNPSALPFEHRITAADPEMFRDGLAQKAAEWRYKRGLYDSFYIELTVEGHHQGGRWIEADTMAVFESEEYGISGSFYVESVHCSSNPREGDLTRLVLRKPGLLSAAFGEIPNPPIVKSSATSREAGAKTSEVKP